MNNPLSGTDPSGYESQKPEIETRTKARPGSRIKSKVTVTTTKSGRTTSIHVTGTRESQESMIIGVVSSAIASAGQIFASSSQGALAQQAPAARGDGASNGDYSTSTTRGDTASGNNPTSSDFDGSEVVHGDITVNNLHEYATESVTNENDESIRDNAEIAGFIYVDSKGSLKSIRTEKTLCNGSDNCHVRPLYNATELLPEGGVILGIYHTHGKATRDKPFEFEFFSNRDHDFHRTIKAYGAHSNKYSNIRFSYLGNPQKEIRVADFSNLDKFPYILNKDNLR